MAARGAATAPAARLPRGIPGTRLERHCADDTGPARPVRSCSTGSDAMPVARLTRILSGPPRPAAGRVASVPEVDCGR